MNWHNVCKLYMDGRFLASRTIVVMANRLQSKSWSCSELVRGAAQVVDAMPVQSLDAMVVDEKHKLLSETSQLSAAELEKLLQD